MKELFNCDLNLITMFAKSGYFRDEKKRHRNLKENYISIRGLTGYVLANDILKEVNVGAVKLKRIFLTIGVEPKYNTGKTYYPESKIQQLKDILSEPKKIAVIDKTGYISNQELIKMFGFTTDKAFNIVLKERIPKVRFGGNVNYFDRDKTIEIFNKYKK